MAKRKPQIFVCDETADGIEAVDRWTCNGYGLEIGGEPVTPLAELEKDSEEIEE